MPTRADELVGAASCEARAGRSDDALSHLEEATKRGYREPDSLETDEDLLSLHSRRAWLSILEKARNNQKAYEAHVNLQLRQLRTADQADRQEPINWAEVTPRDVERRKQVAAIVAAGGAVVAEDFLNASVVFQHSDDTEGIRLANTYAHRAVELQPDDPLMNAFLGATEDRLLVRQGKLQRYGTQLQKEGDTWVMLPVDASVSDAEREAHYLPTLTEARANLAAMNGAPQ